MTVDQIKQRFGIIGRSEKLYRALHTALQVAPTDLSVLITGESGVGKEAIPQVIHAQSARKHHQYIAVNCGAIPEGTIDSELFGHEKGSFTGASASRKGYFEVADQGTIFLDEVAELPMQTQVRLLRVLETGEFIRVGSSKPIKTNVRVIAATNVNVEQAIKDNKFREDLFYRLNTVPIFLPPLRDRKEDIHLLFRKFSSDFAQKYRMPQVKLLPEAIAALENYYFPGNIRQLKNISEQISVIEKERIISKDILMRYLPNATLPVVAQKQQGSDGQRSHDFSERDLLYKVLFDMKKDVSELKMLLAKIMQNDPSVHENKKEIIALLNDSDFSDTSNTSMLLSSDLNENQVSSAFIEPQINTSPIQTDQNFSQHQEIEESLSIVDQEKELIKKALQKHRGKRKNAAKELGISERTLYRKIKEYELS